MRFSAAFCPPICIKMTINTTLTDRGYERSSSRSAFDRQRRKIFNRDTNPVAVTLNPISLSKNARQKGAHSSPQKFHHSTTALPHPSQSTFAQSFTPFTILPLPARFLIASAQNNRYRRTAITNEGLRLPRFFATDAEALVPASGLFISFRFSDPGRPVCHLARAAV